jgi:hypothetical protein
MLRPLLPRLPCASERLRSQLWHRFIPATPRRRRRAILDILLLDTRLLDILLRRRQARRKAIPAMVILAATPATVIPALTPATVIPEPTPIIHTPTGVGLVGVIRGAGAGVGPGSRSAGAGAAGGAAEDVGTAGSAVASEADLLMPVSMAEGSGVASTAVAVAAIVS